MSNAINKMLLSWGLAPSLGEAISARVQSLARALSATTDPRPSLATVKNGLESILTEIIRTTRGKANIETAKTLSIPLRSRPTMAGMCQRTKPLAVGRCGTADELSQRDSAPTPCLIPSGSPLRTDGYMMRKA